MLKEYKYQYIYYDYHQNTYEIQYIGNSLLADNIHCFQRTLAYHDPDVIYLETNSRKILFILITSIFMIEF